MKKWGQCDSGNHAVLQVKIKRIIARNFLIGNLIAVYPAYCMDIVTKAQFIVYWLSFPVFKILTSLNVISFWGMQVYQSSCPWDLVTRAYMTYR